MVGFENTNCRNKSKNSRELLDRSQIKWIKKNVFWKLKKQNFEEQDLEIIYLMIEFQDELVEYAQNFNSGYDQGSSSLQEIEILLNRYTLKLNKRYVDLIREIKQYKKKIEKNGKKNIKQIFKKKKNYKKKLKPILEKYQRDTNILLNNQNKNTLPNEINEITSSLNTKRYNDIKKLKSSYMKKIQKLLIMYHKKSSELDERHRNALQTILLKVFKLQEQFRLKTKVSEKVKEIQLIQDDTIKNLNKNCKETPKKFYLKNETKNLIDLKESAHQTKKSAPSENQKIQEENWKPMVKKFEEKHEEKHQSSSMLNKKILQKSSKE